MGKIISGKEVAKLLRADIKSYVEKIKSQGKRVPCLATIIVGNDSGSLYYINNQNKICNELGVDTRNISFKENISEAELIETIHKLNEDDTVDGIMLQIPLPRHIDEKKVTSTICADKDIDGLTDKNLGKFYKGEKSFIPCTANSALELIKSTGISIEGKKAVVIGRSNIVGKPTANLLLNENATVTICHSRTQNLKEICKEADILVVAMGKPNFVSSEYVKEGAIVIDVGTSSLNGKICGDVNFQDVIDKAAFITPVPGGVGALTTTLLIRNTCEASEKNVY